MHMVFGNRTSLFPFRTEAAVRVGMGFSLGFSANQNGFITAAVMGVVFRDRTGRIYSITGSIMLMIFFCVLAGLKFFPAGICMHMAFLHCAGLLSPTLTAVIMSMGFCGQCAVQRIDIAAVRVDMVFNSRAQQLCAGFITDIRMDVAFIFRDSTDQLISLRNITAFGMDMVYRRLGFSRDIATFYVDMGLMFIKRTGEITLIIVATSGMVMDHIVRLTAGQNTLSIIAALAVSVDLKTRPCTDQCFFLCRGITGGVMLMLIHSAEGLRFHCNGR